MSWSFKDRASIERQYLEYQQQLFVIKHNRTISMHNTYSLKAILESDLDPTLCKLMLHQIKSPLLEHSFQLTADDEQNGGSFSIPTYSQRSRYRPTIERIPEVKYRNREQIEKQKQFERMHQRLNEMSQVISQNQSFKQPRPNQSYDQAAHQQRKPQQQPRLRKHEQITESASLVSPLQYNPKMGPSPLNGYLKSSQKDMNNNMFLLDNPSTFSDNITQNQQSDNGVARWCGEVFDTENAYLNQVVFDQNFRPYRRKNIFQKKQPVNRHTYDSTQQHTPNNKKKSQYVTFNQAIARIQQINEPQVANFLQFLQKSLQLLTKLTPHRSKLIQNEHILNKMLLKYNPIDHETRETISNKNRIVNRLGVQKLSDALNRIFKLAHSKGRNQFSHDQDVDCVEDDLEKILQCYNEIEDVIENYVSRRDIVNQLNTIYNLLYEYEISRINVLNSSRTSDQKQPIPPPVSLQSLHQKLQKFLSCLQIDPSSYENLHELSYIWSEMNRPDSYLPTNQNNLKISRQKFINQLCRNDILVHDAVKNIYESNIERKLGEMGFVRNVQ